MLRRFLLPLFSLSLLVATPVQNAFAQSKIAFISTRAGAQDIFSMAADGTGVTNLSNTPEVTEEFPSWQPGGAKLIYNRTDDVWTMNANGSAQTRIPIGSAPNFAAFRPQTTLISYSRFSGFDYDIYSRQSDGSGETLLASNPLGDYHVSWRRDGAAFCFHTFVGQSYQAQIFRAKADGSQPVQLTTPFFSHSPAWSPDGSRIVFVGERDNNAEIWLMNSDGSSLSRLTNNAFADTMPTWSPDGSQIAFVSNRDGNNEIYKMSAYGTEVTRLTDDAADDFAPTWGEAAEIPADAPTVSINDVQVGEVSTNATFQIQLSKASSAPIIINFRLVDGTAKRDSDYLAPTSNSLSFAPGETLKTIRVPLKNDAMDEADEALSVLIYSAQAFIADEQGVATIIDDDATPTLSIGDVSMAEGTGSFVNAVFPVTLSATSGRDVSFSYATANGTAGSSYENGYISYDFDSTSGQAQIPAGQTSFFLSVRIRSDRFKEANETFFINLTTPSNATLSDGQGQCTIINDDTLPGLWISDASASEGGEVIFKLNLSAPLSTQVTVNATTQNQTAFSGGDYNAVNRLVTLPVGATSGTVGVGTINDTEPEGDETFWLNLSNATGAILEDAQGIGTLTNNDFPDFYVSDVSIREGNKGRRSLFFTVALAEPAPFVTSVSIATSDATAQAGIDYISTSALLSFAPNQLSQSFGIPINGDTTSESDEMFYVTLSKPTNATISQAQGKGTLVNDDKLPSISGKAISFVEGNSGTTDAVFTLNLSNSSSQPITLNYSTAAGTASTQTDFVPASGVLTIPAGKVSAQIIVKIVGDTSVEGDESFTLQLSGASGATLATSSLTATIRNDDVNAPSSRLAARF